MSRRPTEYIVTQLRLLEEANAWLDKQKSANNTRLDELAAEYGPTISIYKTGDICRTNRDSIVQILSVTASYNYHRANKIHHRYKVKYLSNGNEDLFNEDNLTKLDISVTKPKDSTEAAQ